MLRESPSLLRNGIDSRQVPQGLPQLVIISNPLNSRATIHYKLKTTIVKAAPQTQWLFQAQHSLS